VATNTRDALVAAAAGLMDAGGLEAVTLREVGRQVGVSRGAPYKHFADKEALLAAVAARDLASLGMQLREASERGGADNDLRALMHRYIAWALMHPVRFRLAFAAWSRPSDELGSAASLARAMLVEAAAAAQRSGQLPKADPERLSALLQALANGAVELALAGHLSPGGKGRASPDDLVDDLFGYLQASAAIDCAESRRRRH
jgi:AcrR family transcriptional regulator